MKLVQKCALLLVVMAMLIATTALATEATPSDAIPEHEHWASCDAPNVCGEYGEPYYGDNIYHANNGDTVIIFDHDAHYDACATCGEVFWEGPHYGSCTGPNVCEYCGYEGNNTSTSHNWEDGEYTFNAARHFYVCPDCGETVEDTYHYAWCDAENRNLCAVCGYEGTGLQISHYGWTGSYEYDATYHYYICEVCGEHAWESSHYAYCDNPKECLSCGYVSEGEDIADILHWDWQYEADGNGHWEFCGSCGTLFGKYTHSALCDQPGVCVDCGYEGSDMEVRHYGSDGYETDETYHYEYCSVCGELMWYSAHYADCDKPGVCYACGVKYDGDNKSHYWTGIWEHDDEKHWMMCGKCDEYVIEPNEHWEYCFNPDGLCDNCGEPFEGDVTHSATAAEIEHDGTYHWYECFYCGETIKEKHYTYSWGEDGVCSLCLTKYGTTSSYTPTVPSTEDEAEETLADVIGEEGEDFLSRFMGNSADAAAGDLLSGEQDVTLTIEANGEAHYEGSVLNVYRAGSREDDVTIALKSKYDAETLLTFKAWQTAIASVAELRATESFTSFVELAEALVQALLPELTEDEVDELIIRLLQSGADGTLENALETIELDEDVDGEIVGYLAEEGYEFILVLRDGEVDLLVREGN